MLISQLLFYLFSALLLSSSIALIFAKHPVHAVLFLILAFLNGAGLFLLQGAELLAMILIIVYVGAIAVFFLFVVMMLDIEFIKLAHNKRLFSFFGIFIGLIIGAEIGFSAYMWPSSQEALNVDHTIPLNFITNTHAIANVLYSKYQVAVIIAGLILLSAMIGTIVITIRQRPSLKRQNIESQNQRSNTIKLVSPKSGEGLL